MAATHISPEESHRLREAYIRRLADTVVLSNSGTKEQEARAAVMLGTATREEVSEAERISRERFPDSGKELSE